MQIFQSVNNAVLYLSIVDVGDQLTKAGFRAFPEALIDVLINVGIVYELHGNFHGYASARRHGDVGNKDVLGSLLRVVG